MLSKNLIPFEERKSPWYVVFTKNKSNSDNERIYVKNFGVQKFPTSIDDSIIEQTKNLCDAIMFCRKEDAEKVAKLCTFKCSCGCVHRVGKLLKVTNSKRQEDGVTYGICGSWDILENKKKYFEVVYDYKELPKEYPAKYDNLLDEE